MEMTDIRALIWTERLIAFAVFLQTVELIRIRQAWGETGIWRWEVLRRDFEGYLPPLQWLFNLLLHQTGFSFLLACRLVAAVALVLSPHPLLTLFLLISTLLIALRWRGTFNGGSDHMTMVVLSGALVARIWDGSPQALLIALGYIAIQSCLSYAVAGIVKIKEKRWRSGRALSALLSSPAYQPPLVARSLAARPLPCCILSWCVILFEFGFPAAVVKAQFSVPLIGLGLFFHLMNAWVLGLNRFFFAWAATYPAVYFVAQSVR